MKTKLILLLVSLYTLAATSQSIPSQWRITDDGKYLIAGDQTSLGIYKESVVEEIRLSFPQTNYWALLTQNYNGKIEIPCKLTYQGTQLDSVGIRFKGQTSYLANNTPKKSFAISVDAFKEGQKVAGYKTFNLNNAFQDGSYMREVLYYTLIRKHTMAAKANFVRLYINDEDWGIYLNVQQLNKDFLEEWYESNDGINIRADTPDGSSTGPGGPGGQWGDGTAGMNYLGSDTTLYQKYYTLKSADVDSPWQQLIKACNVLNNSGPTLETEAPKILDIDKILWHLACEIAFTDDDSYVFKGKMDYYIYQDAETKRWTSYDYDANSCFATNKISTWSPFYNESKVNYPLLNKLLAVPAYRQRYLAHMRTIISELMDESKVAGIIDQYDQLIRPAVLVDTKKVTTLTAYNNALIELKNFIKYRKAVLLASLEVKNASPVITDLKYVVEGVSWGKVNQNSVVTVTARVQFSAGLNKVLAHYSKGFSGTFSTVAMNDSGVQGDGTAGDGIYSAQLPLQSPGSLIRVYVEATGNDAVKSRSYAPAGAEHHVMIYRVDALVANEKTVVINEFMASNNGVVKDEAGQSDDWIELYNLTDRDINMAGYYITDNPDNLSKFKFPENTIIKSNGYLVLWADEEQEQGPLHTNFKLSTSGEVIFLLDNNLTMIDSITFGPQIAGKSSARKPNGTGSFVIGDHTFNINNDQISSISDLSNTFTYVYPNPAYPGTIHVKNTSFHEVKVEVFQVSGIKIIETKVAAESENTLEIHYPGIYLVKTGSVVHKLIVSIY
ncbi:MAG: CotH kinase family protein [Saprospiraceae bacterium]